VFGLSGLTKKSVYADKLLAKILGVDEGAHVSYAELSKGLHKYIRDNHLKASEAALRPTQSEVSPAARPSDAVASNVVAASRKKCRNCESEIPVEAVFCDLCGARQ